MPNSSPNLFGVIKAKPGRQVKASAHPGDVQAVIACWAQVFEAKYGEKPIITGKDGAAVKRLVAHSDARTVVRRLPAYLGLPDEFLEAQGYPLSLMLGQWNRIVALEKQGRAVSTVPSADDTEARMRRLKAGGER